MAGPGTLYRFRLDVSDVGRSFYDQIDVRVPMHPSESVEYLLTRVLAYALNYKDGIELLPGLCVGDEPAIRLLGPNGEISRWIDIGNPSARRLHRASKAARSVRVYTYKDPENLKREASGEAIHRAAEIEVFALSSSFLSELSSKLARDNRWGLIHDDGELVVTIDDETVLGSLAPHRLS